MEMSDRQESMKYLFMVRSAEEGKKYLKDNEKDMKAYMALGYAIVCIGGHIMADEEAEPEKIAFILAMRFGCLLCSLYERCMSKTVSDGCIEVEKIENAILALDMRSRSVEHH